MSKCRYNPVLKGDPIKEEDAVRETCSEQARRCSDLAWQLAADMRHRYGLPEFDDPRQMLKRINNPANAQRERRTRARVFSMRRLCDLR